MIAVCGCVWLRVAVWLGLVVGALQLSAGMAPILADLRTALLAGLGLNPHARPTQHAITAFYKTKGRRAAVDMHKTLRFLRRVFPGVPVRDLRFKDQYRMVSQETTVMLAGNGGGSFVAMFAPPGATVIFTDCNGDSGSTLRFSQEASFWTNFETMRDVRVWILWWRCVRLCACACVWL